MQLVDPWIFSLRPQECHTLIDPGISLIGLSRRTRSNLHHLPAAVSLNTSLALINQRVPEDRLPLPDYLHPKGKRLVIYTKRKRTCD